MEQMRVHDIIERMIHTDHRHRAVCDRELSELGLHRSQMRMLMHLWHGGGTLSQRRLSDEMHISPAVVTVTVQKLETEGYLSRKPSETDRRSMMITLAPRGYEMVDAAHGVLDSVDTRMLRGFSESEKKQLVDFYIRMFDNLSSGEVTGDEMV